ncbi:hypothetical protein J6590_016291 [Homalodisca vitripennis]|nr:hypothetical protein J6590_016291 [Homalodisca vitripennis]
MVGKRDGDGEARGKKALSYRIHHVSPGQSRFNGREERQGRRGARQEVILLLQSETELSAVESITCRRARVDSMVGKRDRDGEARGKK